MICQGCNKDLPASNFPLRKDVKSKEVRRPYCNACRNEIERARYRHHKRTAPFKLKASRAKARAARLKVPFDLDPEYLESIWTGVCPVFNCEIYLFDRSRNDEQAAELDRIVPSLGYVKGNVAFLSRRANRLKNNVTSFELLQLYNWLKEQECK